MDDKRQITAVFAGSLTGDFLPPQLIYKGTTKRCLPGVDFPPDWHITHSHNHWSNESTMKAYVEKIPLHQWKKKRVKVPSRLPSACNIRQVHWPRDREFFNLLEDNHIHVVMVPANCTDRLQPLEISVNKPAKSFLRQQFHKWYAEQIYQHLHDKTDVTPVDLRLNVVKPLGAQWMIQLYDYLKSNPDIVQNGFRAAGILDCITSS